MPDMVLLSGSRPKEIGKFCVLCGQPAHFANCHCRAVGGMWIDGLKCGAHVHFDNAPMCATCLDRKIRELIAELQGGTVEWR